MKRTPLGEITSFLDRRSLGKVNLPATDNQQLHGNESIIFQPKAFIADEYSNRIGDIKSFCVIKPVVESQATLLDMSFQNNSPLSIGKQRRKTKALFQYKQKQFHKSNYNHTIRMKKLTPREKRSSHLQDCRSTNPFFAKPSSAPFEIFCDNNITNQESLEKKAKELECKNCLVQSVEAEIQQISKNVVNITNCKHESSLQIGRIIVNFGNDDAFTSKSSLRTLQVIL